MGRTSVDIRIGKDTFNPSHIILKLSFCWPREHAHHCPYDFVNGATDNFKLTPAIANELAAAIHKKADELVEDIQINCPVQQLSSNNLSYKECPPLCAQVEIMSDASTSPASWSRRYLLSDHNIAAVIIDLGDDASSETVRTDTLRNSDALGSVAGYQVSARPVAEGLRV
eukprot:1159858-Pelagomonas_calceolata.AAC.2